MTDNGLSPMQPVRSSCKAVQDHSDNLENFGPVRDCSPKVNITIKSTSASTITDDETRTRIGAICSSPSVQQTEKRPGSRAQVAVQAYVGPRTKEISTQTSPTPQLDAQNQTAHPGLDAPVGRYPANTGDSTARTIKSHEEDLLAVGNTAQAQFRFDGERRNIPYPMGRATPGLYNDANRQRSHFVMPLVVSTGCMIPVQMTGFGSIIETKSTAREEQIRSTRPPLLDESYPNHEVRAQNPTGCDGASQLRPSGGFVDGISTLR